MSHQTISRTSPAGSYLTREQVLEVINQACPPSEYRGKRVLLIVPDATRTCPLDIFFEGIFDQIGAVVAALDVMIALGTHQPMSEEAICHRLEISLEERRAKYGSVRLFNHEWNNPLALKRIGTTSADEIKDESGGLFAMEVPVNVNGRLFDYDQLIIVGPVFPHEVVGFSGGNKYLFPGVSGPEILNFFHWLGAVITNPMIIGNKWTPVRRVVDRAAGKCMYKLEPVLADGGELIIYAPHLKEISVTHGKLIEEIGYHCRDYFLKQWDKFRNYPWGVLAHSTHVHGIGTYENG